MRRSVPAFASLALVASLAACGREEEPVADKYERARAEIENKAAAYEAQVANEVGALEAQLDNQADLILNAAAGADAAANAAANAAEANAVR